MTTLAGVVQDLQSQRRRVLSNLERIDDALSVAARNRIAAAQRARWSKWKKARKAA